jgi:hypothetical protein
MNSSNDKCNNPLGWEQDLRASGTATPSHSAAAAATSSKNPKKGLTELPTDFNPTNYSVILGRGKGSYNYVGNKRCRVIVNSFLGEYNKCNNRQERSVIVSKVLDIIEDACPIGGFIKQENGLWYTVEERIAREKIFTMFRDCQNAQTGRSPASSVRSCMRSSVSSSPHKLTSVSLPETKSHRLDINFPDALPLAPDLSIPVGAADNAVALNGVEDVQPPSSVDIFEPIKFDDEESLGESEATAGSFYDIDSCSLCTI